MEKKRLVKIALWGLGACVALFAFFIFLGLFGYPIQNYLILKNQESMIAAGQRRAAKVLEIQKADNYGGKTPEETLDLYIKALKAGDIELASKYYEISVENMELQKEELENLNRILLIKGKMSLVIEEVENIRNLCFKNVWPNGTVSFVYDFVTKEEIRDVSVEAREEITTIIPVGTKLSAGNSLKLNPYTKVWKIIQ